MSGGQNGIPQYCVTVMTSLTSLFKSITIFVGLFSPLLLDIHRTMFDYLHPLTDMARFKTKSLAVKHVV